jgi:CRISPR-associated endonuclease/helicase Cas3
MGMRILAKSVPKGHTQSSAPLAVFLPGHLSAVYESSVQLLAHTAREQLSAIGLGAEDWLEPFQRSVKLACALHDLGKANDHFQALVQPDAYPNRRGLPQGLRHEWVSLLILSDANMHNWLMHAVGHEYELQIALWAITGHHPAYTRPSPPREPPSRGEGSEMRLLLDHEDVGQSMALIARWFGLPEAPTLERCTLKLAGAHDVFTDIQRFHRSARSAWGDMDADWRKLVAAAKACVIGADVAGSALPTSVRSEEERRVWIGAVFACRPTTEQIEDLITERLTDPSSGTVHELRPFQRAVGEQAGDVTFVKAGCGSGKTLAAYHWAHTVCPGRRLYFCYPTTGTATEGFRDYLWEVDGQHSRAGAELFHGRAAVDLDIIIGAEDALSSKERQSEHQDHLARIQSLVAWSTPIVSCTVDTVLGLMQNNRRGLYAWPALAGAAFVFDEVHSYDDKLFAALLGFISTMQGAPVLVMTASLPVLRLDALRAAVRRRGSELRVPERTTDLAQLEELPRYLQVLSETQPIPLQMVREELVGGGKVLWVCNTVQRAMDAAKAAQQIGLQPIIYHSRFRYEDRVARHAEVVDAFRRPGDTLAVTTQVAEMSLDLSATLLISDLAPVPALIQRLGRLNRRALRGDPVRPFLILEPTRADGKPLNLPYTDDELVTSRQWLGFLSDRHLSQADLAEAWERLQDQTDDDANWSVGTNAWLDGGPSTSVLELRKASAGITVMLERDLPALERRARRLVQVLLPMPPPRNTVPWRTWPRHHGVPVVPSDFIEYDPQRGAKWRVR